MNNYKNYLSINVISFIGYIFFMYLLIAIFIIYPQVHNFDITENNSQPYALYGFLVQASFIIFISCCFVLSLFFSIFLEFLFFKLRKNKSYLINISNKYKHIHNIILIIGFIFACIPVILETYFILAF